MSEPSPDRDPGPNRTRLLGLLVLLLGVVIVAPHLRSEAQEPETASCPMEFPQTRMAATLLWNTPSVGYVEPEPTPVEGHHPEDLRLLETATDGEACARIHAAIPDSLKPIGLLAPRFAAFYEIGDLYVVPVEPRISAEEMEAEVRGERILDESGVVFVFDREMNVVTTVEN